MRAEQLLAAQRTRADDVHALRARARATLNTAQGERFTSQRLLLARPNRLRVQVLGLLGQPQLAVATDGEWLDRWDAGHAGVESERLSQALLADWLGLPLAPREVVAWLLATPPLPPDETPTLAPLSDAQARAAQAQQAAWVLRFTRSALYFDHALRLRVFERAGEGAQPGFRVSYADWRETSGGAQPFWLRFETTGTPAPQRLTLTLRAAELNPALALGMFRLTPAAP